MAAYPDRRIGDISIIYLNFQLMVAQSLNLKLSYIDYFENDLVFSVEGLKTDEEEWERIVGQDKIWDFFN